MSVRGGLARKSIGAGGLWLLAVGASAPMTVLVGGVGTTYAATGVVAVPLSFLVLAAVLALLSAGYLAVSRYVGQAAPFYAVFTHGLNRAVGVAGGFVAVLAYNVIEISLYGLVGFLLAEMFGGRWWAWALGVWALIAVLGVRQIVVSARVLAWTLVAELGMIVLFDLAAFTHPADGVLSLAPLLPDRLLVPGVGGVFAFGIAAFVGYECGPVYAEEAREHRSVLRATYSVLAFLGGFYTLSSWGLAVSAGPGRVAQAVADDRQLPLTVLANTYGPAMAAVGAVFLIGSIVAAMLSFHHTVARYLFALGRDRVLPKWVAGTGRRGAPVAGSLVQSAIAVSAVTLFAVADADPVATMFTWLAALAAVGVLVLLTATSAAAVVFFTRGGGGNERVWTRSVAPRLGGLAGLAVLVTTVWNMDSLLGVPAGSPLTRLIPASVAITALAGLGWAALLRMSRPQVYTGIGRGRPHPLRVLDPRLEELEV